MAVKYQQKEYWDERYAEEDDYEWFMDFEALRPHIMPHISPFSKSCSILMLGCGNSQLSMDLYNAGYQHIVNIDYSPNVINRQRERAKQLGANDSMSWRTEDMFDLQKNHPVEYYDVVIDKGTVDAVLAGINPWHVDLTLRQQLLDLMEQVHLVLKPRGKYISLTWAQPLHRIPLLLPCHNPDQCNQASKVPNWSVSIESIHHGIHFQLYCFTKDGGPLSIDQRRTYFQYWDKVFGSGAEQARMMARPAEMQWKEQRSPPETAEEFLSSFDENLF